MYIVLFLCIFISILNLSLKKFFIIFKSSEEKHCVEIPYPDDPHLNPSSWNHMANPILFRVYKISLSIYLICLLF